MEYTNKKLIASLLVTLMGAVFLAYGWTSAPEALSLIEQLQMPSQLQQTYNAQADRATFMKLLGCVLVGSGLVSFVIIRSIMIHSKAPK